ncbi:MAG TPA: hypothetical protein EYP43_00680 [Thermoplasmata archaeon]|nr:hypothetical protein [Thermoplasmata archaeon]
MSVGRTMETVVEGRDQIVRFLRGHPRPVPSDVVVTIEDAGDVVIVNAAFGSRTNMALAHLLATMLSARSGASVGKQVDPTRILLRTVTSRAASDVREILLCTDPGHLDEIIRRSLLNSGEVRWHLFQVARRFGAVRRDADIARIGSVVLARYRGTALFEEAVESYLWDRMDVGRAREVLRAMQEGTIRLETTPLSPIGRNGMDRYGDLVRPFRSDRTILRALEARLRGRRMALVCLSCRNVFHGTAERGRRYRCARCGSTMIAAMPSWQADPKEIRRALASMETARPFVLSANLVREHGDRALMCLAARGVGPTTAARLLRLYGFDELELLRGILNAEVTFARTHRFWD